MLYLRRERRSSTVTGCDYNLIASDKFIVQTNVGHYLNTVVEGKSKMLCNIELQQKGIIGIIIATYIIINR